MRRHLSLAATLAVATAASCSSGPGVVAPIGAPSLSDADLASLSPATWRYRPSSVRTVNATLDLNDGSCVVVTGDGERWVVAATGKATTTKEAPTSTRHNVGCRGDAVGATFGAPEPLRRIVRAGSTFRFIGESGTLYEATTPLGSFDRTLTPPIRLARVATHGESTVGLSSAGDPYWLEHDGWVRGDGGGAHLFDVEVDDDGRALAIAWPEQVLLSHDGGRTFRPTKDVPRPIGALAVRSGGGAPLTAVGISGQLAWPAGGDTLKPQAVSRNVARSDVGAAEVRVRWLSPQAQAVAPARAVLTGSRWYEIRAASELPHDDEAGGKSSTKGWAILRGKLDGELESAPLHQVPDDHEARMGASGAFVVVGFMDKPEDGDSGPPRLALIASSDEGRTFHPMARLGCPDIRQVRIAVSATGDALVAGACPSVPKVVVKTETEGQPSHLGLTRGGRKDDDDEACRPRAPVVVKAGAKGRPAVVSVGVATDLRGLAVAPAFSTDGSSLYFLGRRAKGQEPSIFHSEDGGSTWTSRPMLRKGTHDDDDDDERRHRFETEDGDWEGSSRVSSRRVDLVPEEPLSVDTDGALGVVVDTPSGRALLSAGADGEVRAISPAPDSSAVFAAYGRRAVAAAVNGPVITTWETSDGGATWDPAGILRARLDDGEAAIACSAGGCVLGDAVTRIGWDAREEDARATAPPTRRPRAPSLRTPLSCDLDAKPWTLLEGVEVTAPFPTVDEVARGRSSWSLLSVDAARGAVTVHAAVSEAGEPQRLTSRPLLEPATSGKSSALRVLHQGEGYAAARVQEGKQTLEVGWVNFFDGVVGKRMLEPKKPIATVREGANTSLKLGLLSVSTGGVFVQPGESQELAFLDNRGGTSWGTLPDWGALGVPGRTRGDAARVGGRTLHVGVLEAGPTIGLLAVDQGRSAPTTYEAATLGPPRSIGAGSVVSWAYLGPTPGFLLVAADPTGDGWATASYRAFENGMLGAPLAVPTSLDLPDRPRPCRAEEIKTTPRVESLISEPSGSTVLVRGQRHPVEIPGAGDASSPDGTLRLLTSGAVLHGTPRDPCLAGWEATAYDGRRGAAVILGDLSRAWAFRIAANPNPRGPAGGAAIEVHGMTCRFDPSLPIPPGAWDEVGVR